MKIPDTIVVLLVCFLLNTANCFSQTNKGCETENTKAEKPYLKAKELLRNNKFGEAGKILDVLVEEEPEYIKGIYLLAEVRKYQQYDEKAISLYKKVLELCPDYRSDIYFDIGFICWEIQKYDTATRYFDLYLSQAKKDPKKEKIADSIVSRSENLDKLFKTPVPFDPKPIEGVCTQADEYLPILSPDNELFFFTRRYTKVDQFAVIKSKQVEDFCVSKIEKNVFPKGEKLPTPFNAGSNEGGASISIDNKQIFITCCNLKSGMGSCDIYSTEFDGFTWSPLKNLGKEINSKEWDSQVSLSSDGKTLYFASDRDSGIGGMDIYKIEKDTEGNWSKPENLGKPINTEGDEKSPFIHTDNQTLYFSSRGHIGLGGFDIYISRKDSNGNWTAPKNIGYPINSEEDDLGFFVSTDGKRGFFASNKLKGFGGWDIYGFDLYEGARPQKVLFLKGEIKDEHGDIITDTKIELKDLATKKITYIPVDNQSGKYVFAQALKNDVSLSFQKEGHFYHSEIISKNDTTFEKPKTIDVQMEQFRVGSTYRVNNILFTTDSYELNDKGKYELDNFIDFMKNNPSIIVGIHGYTDDIDEDSKNMILSKNRAKVVYDYVVENGLEANRLSHQGFGETHPIASNETEEGRALNRRTEIIILEK